MNQQLADEIQREQEHGRQKYGGDANNLAHDDAHTDDEWARFIADHNERARQATPIERRQHLVKVAGLAASAIEAIDRRDPPVEMFTPEWFDANGFTKDNVLGYVRKVGEGPECEAIITAGTFPFNDLCIGFCVGGFTVVTNAESPGDVRDLIRLFDGSDIDHPHIAEIDFPDDE